MKAFARTLLVGLVAGTTLLPGAGRVSAQTLNLTFDYSQLANPAYSGSNLYVTFQANSGSMSVNGDLYTFNTGTVNGSSLLTKSYAMSDLTSSSVSITNVTSMIGYISYGSSSGFNNATAAPDPFSTPTRYSNFELTYNNGVGQADITQIAQFGGGLQQTLYTTTGGATPVAYTGNNFGNTQTTSGAIMQSLAAVPGNTSNAVITTGPGGTGDYVRVIGPSKFGNPGVQNEFPTFTPYLESLSTTSNNGTLSVAKLENLKPGAQPGGAGSNGLVYTGSATSSPFVSGTTYLANYYFGAYVTPVVTVSGTTYQVLLSGSMTMANSANEVLKTYTGLEVTLAADSGTDLYMTNNLYSQVLSGQGTNVSFSSAWNTFNADFNTGNATMQPEVVGDFTQGILAGLVGNSLVVSGTAIGDMTSAQWWDNSLLAYLNANPEYQNQYGAIIFANTGGFNSATISGSFNSAAIYGNPYDDRWGSPLINFTTDTTNTLLISLIPDGTLAVPEPGSVILAGMAAASLLFFRKRRA
jgi:hypothetical protein